jgi:hypothetical protein
MAQATSSPWTYHFRGLSRAWLAATLGTVSACGIMIILQITPRNRLQAFFVFWQELSWYLEPPLLLFVNGPCSSFGYCQPFPIHSSSLDEGVSSVTLTTSGDCMV